MTFRGLIFMKCLVSEKIMVLKNKKSYRLLAKLHYKPINTESNCKYTEKKDLDITAILTGHPEAEKVEYYLIFLKSSKFQQNILGQKRFSSTP